jgi:hypothetical protein
MKAVEEFLASIPVASVVQPPSRSESSKRLTVTKIVLLIVRKRALKSEFARVESGRYSRRLYNSHYEDAMTILATVK